MSAQSVEDRSGSTASHVVHSALAKPIQAPIRSLNSGRDVLSPWPRCVAPIHLSHAQSHICGNIEIRARKPSHDSIVRVQVLSIISIEGFFENLTPYRFGVRGRNHLIVGP